MSKYRSIYIWENVDKTIQIIESRIEFNTKTTEFYGSKYFSKEDKGCSLQSYHLIRESLQLNRILENGHGFKSHFISLNERFYKL